LRRKEWHTVMPYSSLGKSDNFHSNVGRIISSEEKVVLEFNG